jgi:hypothetical protein
MPALIGGIMEKGLSFCRTLHMSEIAELGFGCAGDDH